jgi:mannose/fructose/N-acetylgalactosamine-specific phosphotransferase system component IIB
MAMQKNVSSDDLEKAYLQLAGGAYARLIAWTTEYTIYVGRDNKRVNGTNAISLKIRPLVYKALEESLDIRTMNASERKNARGTKYGFVVTLHMMNRVIVHDLYFGAENTLVFFRSSV